MTDEQLIDLIRSSFRAEVAGLEPPSDLIQSLRGEIARGHRGPARLRRLRLPSFGGARRGARGVLGAAFAVLLLVSCHHRSIPPLTMARRVRAARRRFAVLAAGPRRRQTGVPEVALEGGTIPKLRARRHRSRGREKCEADLAAARPPASLPSGSTATHFSPRLGDQVYVIAGLGPTCSGEPVPAAGLDEPGTWWRHLPL